MKKFFITKPQIALIVKHYGGYRKYKINYLVKKERNAVYLCNKKEEHEWMVIENRDSYIEVRFTDVTGRIVNREYWELVDEIPVKRKEREVYEKTRIKHNT